MPFVCWYDLGTGRSVGVWESFSVSLCVCCCCCSQGDLSGAICFHLFCCAPTGQTAHHEGHRGKWQLKTHIEKRTIKLSFFEFPYKQFISLYFRLSLYQTLQWKDSVCPWCISLIHVLDLSLYSSIDVFIESSHVTGTVWLDFVVWFLVLFYCQNNHVKVKAIPTLMSFVLTMLHKHSVSALLLTPWTLHTFKMLT